MSGRLPGQIEGVRIESRAAFADGADLGRRASRRWSGYSISSRSRAAAFSNASNAAARAFRRQLAWIDEQAHSRLVECYDSLCRDQLVIDGEHIGVYRAWNAFERDVPDPVLELQFRPPSQRRGARTGIRFASRGRAKAPVDRSATPAVLAGSAHPVVSRTAVQHAGTCSIDRAVRRQRGAPWQGTPRDSIV
ncbi:MAG: hypothetical protein JO128_22760 [Alphaproteobacteria bacterium]|nr:hypothetical protein [Alphaproteobacteria bacterium]